MTQVKTSKSSCEKKVKCSSLLKASKFRFVHEKTFFFIIFEMKIIK